MAEYIPFIILLTALFTVAGGIYMRGNLHGSPALNIGILAIGAVLASFMGTTGASMLLIRPLIRANDNRKHVAHVVVFFIFIVTNAGGSLTPLGDPPLFLGFLKGVDFFWTVQHIFPETLFLVGALLAIFYAIDTYWYRKEGVLPARPDARHAGVRLRGRASISCCCWPIMVLVLLQRHLEVPASRSTSSAPRSELPALVRDVGARRRHAACRWRSRRRACASRTSSRGRRCRRSPSCSPASS